MLIAIVANVWLNLPTKFLQHDHKPESVINGGPDHVFVE
jgi:hypothetical protein